MAGTFKIIKGEVIHAFELYLDTATHTHTKSVSVLQRISLDTCLDSGDDICSLPRTWAVTNCFHDQPNTLNTLPECLAD